MSFPAPLHRYTYADYTVLEEHSPVRHEYVAGEIYAMAGGTPGHAALAAMALRLVGNQLPAGCRAYTSDLRVRVEASDVSTYPDGAVICGKAHRAADDPLAVTNPLLLIEVTSPSTEAYDRGTKLEQYRLLPALREVLLVSHRERRLTVWRRGASGEWSSQEAADGSGIELTSIGARLAVDDVYRDYDFTE
jgi:Uma2 family endonuclease